MEQIGYTPRGHLRNGVLTTGLLNGHQDFFASHYRWCMLIEWSNKLFIDKVSFQSMESRQVDDMRTGPDGVMPLGMCMVII